MRFASILLSIHLHIMEIEIIIIGLICVALFILPFYLSRRNRIKREKKFLDQIMRAASAGGGKISKHDFLQNGIIGLDEGKGNLFFYHELNAVPALETVELAKMQTCRLLNLGRNVAREGGTGRVTEKIQLAFKPQNKEQSEIILEFYNAEQTVQLSDELKLAIHWEQFINTNYLVK